MKDVIKTLMEGDATLAALLTGGVFTGREVSRTDTAGAFDANGELQPCVLVKVGGEFAEGPDEFAGRQFIDIYFYERDGFTVIDQAIPAAYSLLHREKIGDASDKVFETRWTNDIRDQEDGALGSSLSVSRYEVVRHRG